MATRGDGSKGYEGRHRNAATPQRSAAHRAEPLRGSTGSVVRALRRPAVTASIGLAVVATTAAGYQASDGHQTGQAGFTVSAEAIEQANELANTQIENDAQLASARNQANTSRAALQEKGRRDQLVAAAAAAQARKQAAERAARAKEREALQKQREAVIARRSPTPRPPPVCCCPTTAGATASSAAWTGCGRARAAGTQGDQLLLGRLRHPAVAARAPRWPPSAPTGTTNPATQIKWGLQYIQDATAHRQPVQRLGLSWH